ncbi:hypothetical protein D6D22_05992 [Aureobasidium pullulans]|uniref:Aminoglycoside phosphotransferase domain-containing protein n=1 Tax=Aureobasidium pullulans TaxID=5580 RepID=A0A4S8XJ45_AURPU|nr:hypothetical protein D6D22_05992 [Aureobasidium pullulans]
MAENNANEPVPIEAVQEQHEAIVTAATAAIDLDHSNEDPDDEDDRWDQAIFEQHLVPRITALASEQNVVFDDITDRRRCSGLNSNTFAVTLRNPPAGAPWTDGTRALIRIRITNEEYHVELSDSEAGDSSGEDAPSANSQIDADAGLKDDSGVSDLPIGDNTEVGEGLNIPESPVSVTSNASASSIFSASILVNDLTEEDGQITDASSLSSDDDGDSDEEGSDTTSLATMDSDRWPRRGPVLPNQHVQVWRLDETLVLNLLEDHGIPVPRTLAYDCESQNGMKCPYSIQTLSSGKPMLEVYRNKEMSLQDRLWLAGEIAEIRARLETVQFEGSGRLLANEDEHSSAGELPLRLSSRADITEQSEVYGYVKGAGFVPSRLRSGNMQHIFQSLYDLMIGTVGDVIKAELACGVVSKERRLRRYFFLKDMIRDMDRLGWFSEADRTCSKTVIKYWNHDADQTLVERTDDPSTPWRLTALTGWENPEALPPVLTRKPSAWLWHHHNDDVLSNATQLYWEGDHDWLPVEMPYLSPDDLAVKQRYEDVLIEKLYTPQYGERARDQYLDDTYGRGRWLRRAYRFAQEGITADPDSVRFNALILEWNEYMKEKSIQYESLSFYDGTRYGPLEGPRMYVPGIKYEVDPTSDRENCQKTDESYSSIYRIGRRIQKALYYEPET